MPFAFETLGESMVIHVGNPIDPHKHGTNDGIDRILSRTGKAIRDKRQAPLRAGMCHICKKDSEHSIVNADDNLTMLTVAAER